MLPEWILWCLHLGHYSVVPEAGAGFNTAVASSFSLCKALQLLPGYSYNEIIWQQWRAEGGKGWCVWLGLPLWLSISILLKKKKSQPQQLILMVMRVARTVTMTTGRTWRAHLPTSQAQNTISCRMACPCGEAPPTSPTKQCLFHLITNTSCQFPVLLPARLCCRPTRRAGLSRFNRLTHCLTHQCQKAALEKN